jgi:hypothetical protein
MPEHRYPPEDPREWLSKSHLLLASVHAGGDLSRRLVFPRTASGRKGDQSPIDYISRRPTPCIRVWTWSRPAKDDSKRQDLTPLAGRVGPCGLTQHKPSPGSVRRFNLESAPADPALINPALIT